MKTKRLDYKLSRPYAQKKVASFSVKNIVFGVFLLSVFCVGGYYIVSYVLRVSFSKTSTQFASKEHLLLIHEYPAPKQSFHSAVLLSFDHSTCTLSFYPENTSLDDAQSLKRVYDTSGREKLLDHFNAFGIRPLYYLVLNAEIYPRVAASLRNVVLHYDPNEALRFPVNLRNQFGLQSLYYLDSQQVEEYLGLAQRGGSVSLEGAQRWMYVLLQFLRQAETVYEEYRGNKVLEKYLIDSRLPASFSQWIDRLSVQTEYYVYPYTYRGVDETVLLEPSMNRYGEYLDVVSYYYKTHSVFTAANYFDILVKQGLVLLDTEPLLRIVDCRKDSDTLAHKAFSQFFMQFQLKALYEPKDKHKDYCHDGVKNSYIINRARNIVLLRYIQNILRIGLFYDTFNVPLRENEFLVILGDDFHDIEFEKNEQSNKTKQ